MNTKYKILIMLFVSILFGSIYSLAYSFFNSDTDLSSDEQAVAKFIFNADSLDDLQLSLHDLVPGDDKEYAFSVNNNSSGKTSNVTLNYQMTIKTYHFIPLVIELYKVNNDGDQLIFTCDETAPRDEHNELICAAPIQEMPYSSEEIDNYKLKVSFPSTYNDVSYSDLVDFLNVEINSWQKTED